MKRQKQYTKDTSLLQGFLVVEGIFIAGMLICGLLGFSDIAMVMLGVAAGEAVLYWIITEHERGPRRLPSSESILYKPIEFSKPAPPPQPAVKKECTCCGHKEESFGDMVFDFLIGYTIGRTVSHIMRL